MELCGLEYISKRCPFRFLSDGGSSASNYFSRLLLAYGSLAAGVATICWKRDCVADAVPLSQYTLVLISPTSEG